MKTFTINIHSSGSKNINDIRAGKTLSCESLKYFDDHGCIPKWIRLGCTDKQLMRFVTVNPELLEYVI